MKKIDRAEDSSKTFLNQWETMGFRKLRKRTPPGD